MKDNFDIIEEQVEKTAALLQEGGVNYSIIVLKEEKMFSCWCRTEDDAMALLMAAILLRVGRQDVHLLMDALNHIDIDQIDEFVEENLDEEEDEGDWQ